MHPFLLIMHAIGAPDATASFELQVNREGQEINPEVEVQQDGHEEPEEEIECPNHEPTSFVKGKPRSILSLPKTDTRSPKRRLSARIMSLHRS